MRELQLLAERVLEADAESEVGVPDPVFAGTGTSPPAHLHLLLSVLGRVLAALALPTQLLQLSLALLQTLPLGLVLHLVLLQCSLRGATEREGAVKPLGRAPQVRTGETKTKTTFVEVSGYG